MSDSKSPPKSTPPKPTSETAPSAAETSAEGTPTEKVEGGSTEKAEVSEPAAASGEVRSKSEAPPTKAKAATAEVDSSEERTKDEIRRRHPEVQPAPERPSKPVPWMTIVAIAAVGVAGWALGRRNPAPPAPSPAYSTTATAGLPGAPGTGSSPISPGTAGSVLSAPVIAGTGQLALEVWVKDPEAATSKLIPKLMEALSRMQGGAPLPPTMPTLRMLLTANASPDQQKDFEQLDFTKPIAYVALDSGSDPNGRFVIAATVKDAALAAKTVDTYATREGAIRERSDVLGIDTFKGAKTGRYLALVGNQVFFASDKPTLEKLAPDVGKGWATASTQPHDLVAKVPKAFVSGPFIKQIQGQLFDGAMPTRKALLDEISAKLTETLAGAEDLKLDLDVEATLARVTATLGAGPSTPFAAFLASYPTLGAETLLDIPREAVGGVSFRFPSSWMDLVKRAVLAQPAGAEMPADMKAKADAAFGAMAGQLEGEVLLTNLADPPPYGGPGAQCLRLKIRDEEAAKKAAKEFFGLLIQGSPTTALPMEGGGSGEYVESTPPPQPGQPPLPPMGLAWAVRNGSLFVVTGSTPRARVLKFASTKPEDHAGFDADTKTRVSRITGKVAAALLVAPLRADTPLTAAMKIPALNEALTVGIEPSATELRLSGHLDLGILMQLIAPMLVAPSRPPPGSLPPDAAGTTRPAPTGPRPPPGTGPGPGTRPPPATGPGTRPPGVYIPPAPSGYVLPSPG